MVGDVDAVVHQFGFQILVEESEIDALLQWLVGSGVEHVHQHLVKQGFLIDIAVLYDLLQRFAGGIVGVGIVLEDHGLGHLCRLDHHGLGLEGGERIVLIAYGCLLMGGGVADSARLVGNHRGCVTTALTACTGIDILLQIAQCLIQLQVAGGLVEGTVDAFVKLFLLHVGHLLDVGELHA